MLDTMYELCALNGVSGREEAVRNYIIEKIGNKAEVSVDALGNVIAFVKGRKRAARRVMLDAHMDEVGLIITAVTDDGMLKFATVGGIETAVLMARTVVLNGIYGVISTKPIHLIKKDDEKKLPEKDELYIDIGAKNKEEAETHVSVGDVAAFLPDRVNSGDRVITKALDDRAGCAAVLDIINDDPEYDFYASFSVLEEVGAGARAAAFKIDPQYAIVLESTTAADLRGVPDEKQVCKGGEGAVISFMDHGTLYDRDLFNETLREAQRKGIKCQVKCAVAGGNNAAGIHVTRGGVKTVAISVPCRYIHSPSSSADINDILAVKDLARAMLSKMASGELG